MAKQFFNAPTVVLRLALLLLLLVVLVGVPVQAGRVLNEGVVTKPFRHQVWHQLLGTSVSRNGEVHLSRLRAQPRQLNAYLDQLKAVSPENHPEYFDSRDEELAYWINAHNALALRLILDRYPVNSAAEVSDLMTATRHLIGGRPMSLQEIQAHLIRLYYHRPEAFFALTAYTADAPPVYPQALEGQSLALQLKTQMERVVADPGFIEVLSSETGKQSVSCPALVLKAWFAQAVPMLRQYQRLKHPRQPDNQAVALVNFIMPYLSPESQVLMRKPCAHPVRILPPDPTLRRFHQAEPS